MQGMQAPSPVMYEPIHTFVDPAAGGPSSDYGILSVTTWRGMITVGPAHQQTRYSLFTLRTKSLQVRVSLDSQVLDTSLSWTMKCFILSGAIQLVPTRLNRCRLAASASERLSAAAKRPMLPVSHTYSLSCMSTFRSRKNMALSLSALTESTSVASLCASSPSCWQLVILYSLQAEACTNSAIMPVFLPYSTWKSKSCVFVQVIGMDKLSGCKGVTASYWILFVAPPFPWQMSIATTADPEKQFLLLISHLDRIRSVGIWARSPVRIFVEHNLGFEVSIQPLCLRVADGVHQVPDKDRV